MDAHPDDSTKIVMIDDSIQKYGSIETTSTGSFDESATTVYEDAGYDSLSVSPTSGIISSTCEFASPARSVTAAVNQAIEALRDVKALHDTTTFPMADEHGHLEHYPGEEMDFLHKQRLKRPSQRAKKLLTSYCSQFWEFFKCFYSMVILMSSIGAVMAAIFCKQTISTNAGFPRPIAYIFFWFVIVWLAKMEGGQACLVGLQPVNKALYAHTHPKTLVSAHAAHAGDNMERFIVGRQFLVCLVVFASNLMGATIDNPIIPGLSKSLTDLLLTSGNAVTLIAIIIGQSAQINAANCMLDFINTYFMIFTTYTSLILDASGILHSVYLCQILFAKMANTPIESDEPPRTFVQNIFFWARVCFSTSILLLSCAVTVAAIWNLQTTMYAGVPVTISLILLVFLLSFVGILEGMQIALFAVVNLPPDDLKGHPIAKKSCDLTFTGSNLQAFLIGRQMCVTCCMFVVARLTTLDIMDGDPTIFGVSESIQNIFNTGMLGAFITTVIGSLVWRIVASSFPIAFLSNHLVYLIVRLCLAVEASGVCSAAWPLALIQKKFMFFYTLDEEYIGTPEQRDSALESLLV